MIRIDDAVLNEGHRRVAAADAEQADLAEFNKQYSVYHMASS